MIASERSDLNSYKVVPTASNLKRDDAVAVALRLKNAFESAA